MPCSNRAHGANNSRAHAHSSYEAPPRTRASLPCQFLALRVPFAAQIPRSFSIYVYFPPPSMVPSPAPHGLTAHDGEFARSTPARTLQYTHGCRPSRHVHVDHSTSGCYARAAVCSCWATQVRVGALMMPSAEARGAHRSFRGSYCACAECGAGPGCMWRVPTPQTPRSRAALLKFARPVC